VPKHTTAHKSTEPVGLNLSRVIILLLQKTS
jgi:hypothetical protein